jgi:hypothetical protein
MQTTITKNTWIRTEDFTGGLKRTRQCRQTDLTSFLTLVLDGPQNIHSQGAELFQMKVFLFSFFGALIWKDVFSVELRGSEQLNVNCFQPPPLSMVLFCGAPWLFELGNSEQSCTFLIHIIDQ